MGTFIDGIAASQNVDSSGEMVNIAGMDISSLVGSVFNWEHFKDVPAQIVGKILVAEKIMDESECKDERQQYFWQKCGVPFIYVMGELMDDYKDSAKECAGLFRYDEDHRGETPTDTVGFSIEGSRVDQNGKAVNVSIARKVTITNLPCNKAAIAQLVPSNNSENNDIDSLFKTEVSMAIGILKSESHAKLAPTGIVPPKAPANNQGTKLGQTKTGKDVFSHARIHEYSGFSSSDHRDAAGLHLQAAEKSNGDAKASSHHRSKMGLHMQASGTAERKENRFAEAKAKMATKPAPEAPASRSQKLFDPRMSGTSPSFHIKKAMDAGSSATGAPSTLVNGSALGKESMEISPKKKKSTWFERAEKEYDTWSKKEVFQKFMQAKLPNLALGEIDAIGATLVLKKRMEGEIVLSSMTKALTFGDGLPASKVSPENDATPKPLPKKFHDYKKDVKGIEHTEVEHVHPHYDGKSPDTVFTKAGHKLEGHEKGKFKAGDKVTVKSHMMGTHLLEHGHK